MQQCSIRQCLLVHIINWNSSSDSVIAFRYPSKRAISSSKHQLHHFRLFFPPTLRLITIRALKFASVSTTHHILLFVSKCTVLIYHQMYQFYRLSPQTKLPIKALKGTCEFGSVICEGFLIVFIGDVSSSSLIWVSWQWIFLFPLKWRACSPFLKTFQPLQ